MAKIVESSYGKIKIRLMRVNKHPNGLHVPHEVTVETMLWGDFESAWTEGSNSKIVATDTQKNTIYGIAANHDVSSPEDFGKAVAEHFLKTYPWINKAQVTLREDPWARIMVDGKPHYHAFTKMTTEKRFAEVTAVRDKGLTIVGGIEDLVVLKTAQSSFEVFVGSKGAFVEKDAWTTLDATKDRLFSTSIKAYWDYTSPNVPFNDCYDKIRSCFLEKFAGPADKCAHEQGVPSPSVQLTQYQMCAAAVKACEPHVEKIKVFYGIDGPSGYIVSTTARAKL